MFEHRDRAWLEGEIRRLRRLQEEMDLEVSDLVRAERRFHETERDLQRQMRRMRQLNEYALRTSGTTSVEHVLVEAMRLLRTVYPLPFVAAIELRSDHARIYASSGDRHDSTVGPLDLPPVHGAPEITRGANAWAAYVDRHTPDLETLSLEAMTHVLVPIGRLDGSAAAMLLGGFPDNAPVSYHNAPPRPEDAPMLDVLRASVEAALRNAELHAALENARNQLEHRVAERTSELQSVNDRLQHSLRRLSDTQSQLIEASRRAGMSEIATGVLHNVGNVLNSVNVAATVAGERVRGMLAGRLDRVVGLVGDDNISLDDPGRRQALHQFLARLSSALEEERGEVLEELDALKQHIGHIHTIVSTQQSYAKSAGVYEHCEVRRLVDDAVALNRSKLATHRIELVRFDEDVTVLVDRHKVLQILTNLLSNAVHAIDAHDGEQRRIEVRTEVVQQRVRLSVRDTGVGIPAANLARVFAHGFTTRKDGHGFGLHSSALDAKEMGGALTCQSRGRGRGSTFVLELPQRTAVPA